MDVSHPIQSTNARTMCFYNPKICKLASSRIFRENYRRIICNSKVQFSDKDLYLNLLWGDDKDSLGGGFKASRHFRNTSVEGVMWSRQYLTLILRRLYKYTNTNTQIQLRKYKHTNTNRKKVCRGSHVLAPKPKSSYADCTNLHQGVDLSSFNLWENITQMDIFAQKEGTRSSFFV